MRTDAFVGLIALGAVVTPVVAALILRRWGGLAGVRPRAWLLLHLLGALMCVAVLPRKHIESAIIMRWPGQAWAYHLAQVDNEWWEQVGKLVAIALAMLLARDLRPLFAAKRSALALGYWAGLSYGIGEALLLAALFTWPQWGPLFGVQTFTPYLVGWAYVWERLWTMHIHAVMGGLIGLGLHGWIALRSRRRLVLGFGLAMLFHHLVDGLIIQAAFTPDLARLLQQAGMWFVPLLTVVGLIFLTIVGFLWGKASGATAGQHNAA